MTQMTKMTQGTMRVRASDRGWRVGFDRYDADDAVTMMVLASDSGPPGRESRPCCDAVTMTVRASDSGRRAED
jgi:hypothetical protein